MMRFFMAVFGGVSPGWNRRVSDSERGENDTASKVDQVVAHAVDFDDRYGLATAGLGFAEVPLDGGNSGLAVSADRGGVSGKCVGDDGGGFHGFICWGGGWPLAGDGENIARGLILGNKNQKYFSGAFSERA
jgi:hypothetical protein